MISGHCKLARASANYFCPSSISIHMQSLFNLLLLAAILFPLPAFATDFSVTGLVIDAHDKPVPHTELQFTTARHRNLPPVLTGADGHFAILLDASGKYDLAVHAPGFQPLHQLLSLQPNGGELSIQLTPLITREDTVSVTANITALDLLSPDPAEKVFVRQDLLDANPGRPGAPVSIPGYPIETASSGIKAPQYFAPGVAGDHGEPIAQYIAVGAYLVPNNLSANAHGNGYADPNIFIPQVLESVQVDGGAFNVLQGNHAVNLAAIYGLRSGLSPFLTVTADYRDIDIVTGFSPSPNSLLAFEASYGNGFLDRLEHRQQYKLNAQRIVRLGNHRLTALAIAYYGSSYLPGLVPIGANVAGFTNLGDTIDPRQKDQTHTALFALNDEWQFDARRQLQLSGFFRTYNLSLFSDFGQGLIRQSEFRTVAGQNTSYIYKPSTTFSLLTGYDLQREAPRRDNLDRYNLYTPETFTYGPFTKVASNNVTLTSASPYVAAAGEFTHFFRYYAGWRRDQIDIQNGDLITASNSFQKWTGINSPKATISFLPKSSWFLPLISASFGEAFFTEDPRIGTGTAAGTPLATAHSYQLVASKTILRTDVKLTLGHVTTSAELAKIDPDTGLQENQGPGRLRFLTATAQRNFVLGSLLATFSKADARDLDSGQPTPEAPRTIYDLLANLQKLPLHLQARGEFEFVGAKPLGTGCAPDPAAQCVGVSVREFRAAVAHPWMNNRLTAGINMLIARGYTGQTTENFYPSQLQQIVGVRIPSYASLSLTYRFRNTQ